MLNSMGLNAGSAANANPSQLGARMFAGQLMDRSQPQGQPAMPSGQVRAARQPNVADPVGALLAPKMKKKQPISLL